MLTTTSDLCTPDLPRLDATDLAIVDALASDARMLGRDLAKIAGLSEANISRRLVKLEESGAIRFRAFVPPQLLGMNAVALLSVDTSADPDAPGAAIAKLPSIHFVATTHLENRVICTAVATDYVSLIQTIDTSIIPIAGVRAVEVLPMLQFFPPSPTSTVGAPKVPVLHDRRLRQGFDAVDLALLRVLQRNGRATFAELAAEAKVSATAVADRFRKLIADGIVTPITCADHTTMGRPLNSFFFVRVHGKLYSTAQEIVGAAPAQVQYMAVCGGHSQLIFECSFANQVELQAARANFESIPGVGSIVARPIRHMYKETFDWGTAPPEATGAK